MSRADLSPYFPLLERLDPVRAAGEVVRMAGLVVESAGPVAAVGDFCEIQAAGGRRVRTQVIGFRDGRLLSMPLDEPDGIRMGDRVLARGSEARVPVGRELLGRVLDGFGQPLDGRPAILAEDAYPLYGTPSNPLAREPIKQALATGIRVVDALLPFGKGQRIGIFGGSGVGKTTLLGAMCRHHAADVAVVGLVGERNREVRAFIEQDLGPEGLKRAVVVASTSDRPAPLRVRAGFVALAVAEYFRDQGADVLLILDSVTRLAMAQREIGLAAGEPPAQKGYTPSVFALMPRVFERAGNFPRGSITGLFTVLVEGDDFNEPVCDAVRAILDGHIVLSRQLAAAGHYPAIDVLQSVSRLEAHLSGREQLEAARKLRQALALYHQSEDLIQLGAYVAGSNPQLDASIRARPDMLGFLRQDSGQSAAREDSLRRLGEIAAALP
ncbi:MAG: FliI/YscN family ATPase [Bryobacteraceae bacterium]